MHLSGVAGPVGGGMTLSTIKCSRLWSLMVHLHVTLKNLKKNVVRWWGVAGVVHGQRMGAAHVLRLIGQGVEMTQTALAVAAAALVNPQK